MTPIPALFPLATLVLALAGSASLQPVLQPNEAYAKAGPEQVRKDIRACVKSAEFASSPTHPDVRSTTGGRPDLFDSGRGRDPAYQAAVERCLSNKGYKVNSWE